MKSSFWKKISQYVETQLLMTSALGLVALLISFKAMAATTGLTGAGSTFVEPIFTKWFSEYQKQTPEVNVNYQGIGSGGGIRQLTAGTVDFGASDAPMTGDEEKNAPKPVIHVPVVLGAVVASYNLKLDKPLRLDGTTLAAIFSGKITKWNAPEIAKLNPGLKLPETAIVVATRSDGSGTTAVFTDYLSKVSKDWEGKAGKTADWFKGSVGAKGNAGVAGLIKQSEGTIGYVELVYALSNNLPFATMKNKTGEFIEASPKSVSLAAGGKVVEEMAKHDFKLSITDSNAKGAYPISSFSWLLVYDGMSKDKGAPMMELVKWSLQDSAQDMAAGMNYAPVPKALRTKVLARLQKVQLK
jgi:phosphate transport system substrate-binding protein